MKLLDLHLLAYGPFTDYHLDFAAGREGLHVVFGLNEAGKTSALRALRALLYGIDERTNADFRHDKSALRIGGHFRGADGSELQCYRRKGRKNTLLDGKENPISEDHLIRLLGGVNEPLFEQLFGIDHEALVSGGQQLLLERGREAEALFGAGLGSKAVHALLEGFEQEAQALFAPRASKPKINAELAKLKEIEQKQRDASLAARHWDEARKAVNAAAKKLHENDAKMAEAEKRRSVLERIRRTLPNIAKRSQLRKRLASLGDVPKLEPDFELRREEAVSKRRSATESLTEARARCKRLRDDASSLDISEGLLAEADTIDELRERLGGHRKAVRERPALVSKRATLIEQARQQFKAIRPDLSLEGIDQVRPLLGCRRRATELGGRKEAVEAAVRTAEQRQDECAVKLAEKRDALSRLRPVVPFDGLQQAVDDAHRMGDIDSSIDGANAELRRHEETCARELGALRGWKGSLLDLVGAPLPSAETVRGFEDAFRVLDEKQRGLENSISEARTEQQRTDESLRALSLAGEVPTEGELQEARKRRDYGWTLLRRQWMEGEDVSVEAKSYSATKPLPDAFEGEIVLVDETADRLRRESERVHQQAACQAKIESSRQRIAEAERALKDVANARDKQKQSWEEAWIACGVSPLSPREMSVWLEQTFRLREKAISGGELRAKLDDLERSRDTLRRNLNRALVACGDTGPTSAEHSELRPLLDYADTRLRAFDQCKRRRVTLEETIEELEASKRGLDREVKGAQTELASWAGEWASFMGELGRKETATPGEVSDYIEAISHTLKLVDEAKELTLRIGGIDEELQVFERDVKSLVTRLAPDLSGRPFEEAILQLDSRLSAQRESKSRFDELTKQASEADEEVRKAEAIIRAADQVLADLCLQANCASADELQAVHNRFLEREQITEQLREAEKELVDGGDGLGIEVLEAEAAGVDRDSVAAELKAIEQRIDEELRPNREALVERKLSADREFESMAGSDAAGTLAEEAQQILSGLRGHAEHYMRVKLATRVLRDEIEAFRRKHRDPILARASAYFRELTCGSLATIDTDFDASDQPVLVGLRANGERLRVEAMSTGTRDQLYLALRLATLDHYVETSEPLPFIVDDILIQFDDERARATLAALADFSAKTQVILFTHHRRVVEEAEKINDAAERVFVHELG